MPTCTRRGCGEEFLAEDNPDGSCHYHPGAPVFHEGLKSWSCCSDVNKPVMEFDQFMKIDGCTIGIHTDELPKLEYPTKPTPKTSVSVKEGANGKEVYTSKSVPALAKPSASVAAVPAPEPIVEEEDDPAITVEEGTPCRRKGCSVKFVSDAENRQGEGEGTVCAYHPSPPIFREGSKGYLCCKRRVLEFDEFLKIQGCKQGRHVFAPKVSDEEKGEQLTECRIDHYQTRNEVHVSIFAKKADKDRSTVQIGESQVHCDIALPDSKRFRKTLVLFGPVDPKESSVKYYGTKVEVLLKKADGRSWTVLEKTTQDLGNISLTFGVGGRTGTIGGKEVVLDERNESSAS